MRQLATHLRDGVVKDTARVVGALAHQLDLPRPRRQPQVHRVHHGDLRGDLSEYAGPLNIAGRPGRLVAQVPAYLGDAGLLRRATVQRVC